jgi:hypothetical protein
MSYDVMSLVTDLGDQYEVDPGVMFPATITRIKEVLAGDAPVEIVSKGWTGSPFREPVADRMLKEAESFPAALWDLALKPYKAVGEDASEKEKATATWRASALGFAEGWFKRAFVLAIPEGRKAILHIIKNLDYRRD